MVFFVGGLEVLFSFDLVGFFVRRLLVRYVVMEGVGVYGDVGDIL